MKGKSGMLSPMNKSRATNLIAALVVVAGYLSPAYNKQILTLGYFALSGALTNWLAIHMLFEKVPLLYGSGVVPAHFTEIKEWIRDLIMKEFFCRENLEKYLTQGQDMLLESIDMEKALEAVDYDRLFDVIKGEVFNSRMGGLLAMFGGEGAIEKYREGFKIKAQAMILQELANPDFLRDLLAKSDMDIEGLLREKVELIVQQRLDELTPPMVKAMVQDMMQRHLGWLVVWGGVFGGLIGLAMSFVPAF